MRIKSRRDFYSGCLFGLVGLVFAVASRAYPWGTSARPGAGYFPLILAILLMLMGLIVLVKSLSSDTADGDPVGRFAWRPLIVVMLAITVFGLSIETLGLALSVPILIVIASLAGREFRWLGVMINALVLTVFSWLVFVLSLKLTIPVWPLALID